jgi:hypothetical protein
VVAIDEHGEAGPVSAAFASAEEAEDHEERWRARADRANEATFDELVRRQDELRASADERIRELVDRTRSSMRWIKILSLTTFIAGLALLVLGVGLAVQGGSDASTLWTGLGFGGAGTASIVGVLLYRPMERINRASSDLAQQETLLRTWSIGVDLELMAADTFDRDTVREAAGRLRASSRQLAASLETYVEQGSLDPKASAGDTAKAAGEANGDPA